jgi:hypothetical protein
MIEKELPIIAQADTTTILLSQDEKYLEQAPYPYRRLNEIINPLNDWHTYDSIGDIPKTRMVRINTQRMRDIIVVRGDNKETGKELILIAKLKSADYTWGTLQNQLLIERTGKEIKNTYFSMVDVADNGIKYEPEICSFFIGDNDYDNVSQNYKALLCHYLNADEGPWTREWRNITKHGLKIDGANKLLGKWVPGYLKTPDNALI